MSIKLEIAKLSWAEQMMMRIKLSIFPLIIFLLIIIIIIIVIIIIILILPMYTMLLPGRIVMSF